MLNFLGKLVKFTRVLATIAAVIALVLVVASRLGFNLKTGTIKEYSSGTYTQDGYISTYLGYEFIAPEGCELADIKERAAYSNIAVTGLTTEQIEEEFKEQVSVMDLFAMMPSNVNVVVTIAMDYSASKNDLEPAMKEIMNELRRQGMNVSDDYEVVEYLGRTCGVYTCSNYVNGVKAMQEGYVFVEDGYVGAMMFSYMEGLEADKEVLVNAFQVYE